MSAFVKVLQNVLSQSNSFALQKIMSFKPIDVRNKANQCGVGYHAGNWRANQMKGLNEVSEYLAHYYNNGVAEAEIYP